MDIEGYIKERVKDQQKYFDEKASKNRKKFYSCEIMGSLIGFVITVISAVCFPDNRWAKLVTGLSALGTLIVSVCGICSYREDWVNYRLTSELLKRELFLFKTKSGHYFGLSNDDAENRFVESVESVILKDNMTWSENINKEGE